jgi:dihydroxy-acid dehydratase
MDGVVLLTGCDKTTPSTVMGASSVGLPTIVVPGGPMLNGKYKGQDIGSGTHVWKFDEDMKTGKMTQEDCEFAESCMSRSIGHCMTMGTASTMACMVESLGLTLSGAAAIPAADSRKRVMAQLSGRRIVEMVKENLTIDKVLTREAFENSIKVNAAVGGSSNFIIHLMAIAGRIGVALKLEDFDTLGSKIPLLLNLMPSGKYLMEDFYYAGGLPVILNELKDHLHKNVVTVTGKNHHDNIVGNTTCYNEDVIAPYNKPIKPEAGCVVVKGNLALNGAVIKPSAATPGLMKHTGRAVVFESIEDYNKRIDDPDLDIDETCVMVLKYVGPVGYPGMPEVGNMALPKKILQKGIKDMVRISDGRMSGTAYGTAVLHVSPESAIGGTLALVQNGDMVELDVAQRKLHLNVSEEELAKRRTKWEKPKAPTNRGYVHLYVNHVMGADKGADLDFLQGSSGSLVTRDSH